jgi:CheY-like chemotaxis protein
MNTKILCVDDEESILKGFQLNLRNKFELHLASDGQEGLELFQKEGGFSVVLSDMRMPRMNGAEMLSRIKQIDDEVVTVLLTGHTDFESAMAAVNEGNVFRMLSKPCPVDVLKKVLTDATAQYDLITGKRILLDKTLRGAVDALAQSLATIQPLFFGRAQRVRRLANGLAEEIKLNDSWRVGVAAVFSQLAYLSIPQHLSESVYHRKDLNPETKAIIRDLPEETLKSVALIPGLEDVREILQRTDIQPKFELDDGSGIRTAASILRVALDYDYYQELGHEDPLILKTFQSRQDAYDQNIVAALAAFLNTDASSYRLEEVETRNLVEGMRLKEDLLLEESMLIASSGADIDRALLKIIKNYSSCYSNFPFPQKIQVLIPVA